MSSDRSAQEPTFGWRTARDLPGEGVPAHRRRPEDIPAKPDTLGDTTDRGRHLGPQNPSSRVDERPDRNDERGYGGGGRMNAHAGHVPTSPGDGQELAFFIRAWTEPVLGWDNLRHGPGRPRHTLAAIGIGQPPSPPQSGCRRDRSVIVPPGTRRTSS